MDPNGTGSEKGRTGDGDNDTRRMDGVYTWALLPRGPRRGFGRPEPDGRTREPTRRNIGNGSVPRAVAGCLSLPQDGWRGKKEEERSRC